MDLSNPVIQLCIQGTQAEYARQPQVAWDLYRQAWSLAKDNFERCIAAHYRARAENDPSEIYHWNSLALKYAQSLKDDPRIESFLPSLYINMGRACELLGQDDEALEFYALAASLGLTHEADTQA